MEVTLYLDIFFLINFCMDLFLLWVVKKITKKDCTYKRLLLGALIGAGGICCILFVKQLKAFNNVIGFIILSLVMIGVTYKPKSIKAFIKMLVVVYLTTFCLGGVGIGLFYYTRVGYILNGIFTDGLSSFSLKLLIITCICSYIIIKIFLKYYGKHVQAKRMFCDMKIRYEEHVIEIKGLVDTGNSVCDPFSGLPVIILESKVTKGLLPKALEELTNNSNDLAFDEIDSELIYKLKLRVIPFNTLNNNSGMLIGFKPQCVELKYNDKVKVVKNVVIALVNYKLTRDDHYQALIHPQLMNE